MDYSISVLPDEQTNGTSFHGQTLRFTYRDLVSAFGEPEYVTYSDLVFAFGEGEYDELITKAVNSVCWSLFLEQDAGMDVIFTLYDFYEPCKPQAFPDSYIEWHVGSFEELSLEIMVKIREFVENKIKISN